MHILVAAQTWAHAGHDAQSANQVLFELVRGFRQERCDVSFVCVFRSGHQPDSATEIEGRSALAGLGVRVLPAKELPDTALAPRLRSLLLPKPEDYWPEVGYRSWANDVVRSIGADAVVVPWSERVTPLFSHAPCLRVAYYGDPDPKNLRFMTLPPIQPSRGLLRDTVRSWRIRQFERAHIDVMRQYDLVGEVADNDVTYYRDRGVGSTFYVRMPYIDRCPDDWRGMRDTMEARAPLRIVANIGSQRATGNVLALNYLADHILDRLDRSLGGRYEIHLYGGGALPPDLARRLDRPGVHNVGFVKDIDRALLAAPIFLCLNNATEYKVNQSRYVHAWSLGCCVVAHSDAALSLPDMIDGENALLGADPDAIVECIASALADRDLRRRLGAAGRDVFLERFTGLAVSADIAHRMRDALVRRTADTRP